MLANIPHSHTVWSIRITGLGWFMLATVATVTLKLFSSKTNIDTGVMNLQSTNSMLLLFATPVSKN